MKRSMLAVLVGVSLVTAGCGGDDGGEGDAVDTIAVTTPPTISSTVVTTPPSPTTERQAEGEPCALEHVQITLGTTEGAMGNQYTPIVFTNAGTTSCTLTGYPAVTFVDTTGADVGEPASQTGAAGQPVTLAVGAQAHATMDYHDPGFFDDCAPAATAAIEIALPDQEQAVTIPFPSSLCTNATPEPEVRIEAIAPGANP